MTKRIHAQLSENERAELRAAFLKKAVEKTAAGMAAGYPALEAAQFAVVFSAPDSMARRFNCPAAAVFSFIVANEDALNGVVCYVADKALKA